MALDLTERVFPATEEKVSWHGETKFTLTGDRLKIESAGMEYLDFPIPEGETYRFRLTLSVEKL